MVRRAASIALVCAACRDPGSAATDPDDPFETVAHDMGSPWRDTPSDEVPTPGVVWADPPPPPVSGGTLLLSHDGTRLFAADPDRDMVYVVDVDEATLLHTVELPLGVEPGRLAESSSGLVHVALRRGGQVITIDPDTGDLGEARAACANPRGIAVDPADDSVLVACAEGVLVRLRPDGIREQLDLGEELRDIVDVGPPVRVSTFRTPRVLTIDASGAILDARAPVPLGVREGEFIELSDPPSIQPEDLPLDDLMIPNTARRTGTMAHGAWFMLHQVASTRTLSAASRGYSAAECIPVQAAVLSVQGLTEETPRSWGIPDVSPAFDADVTEDGELTAVVGNLADGGALGLLDDSGTVIEPTVQTVTCGSQTWIFLGGEPTSVVLDDQRRAWVLSREPATLVAVDSTSRQVVVEIELSRRAVFDTGHELFHRPTESTIACVLCHPEGRDDGQIWDFDDVGRRRTQAIDFGLDGTQPFHWRGEHFDFMSLHEEVFVRRMGGPDWFDPEPAAALQRWLFSLRPLRPPEADPEAIERGRVRFVELGCGSCHLGPKLTNNVSEDMGTYGLLQVPSLHGVMFRPPYMHDGRRPDLRTAIDEMLHYSTPGGSPTETERDEIRVYLESLGGAP